MFLGHSVAMGHQGTDLLTKPVLVDSLDEAGLLSPTD